MVGQLKEGRLRLRQPPNLMTMRRITPTNNSPYPDHKRFYRDHRVYRERPLSHSPSHGCVRHHTGAPARHPSAVSTGSCRGIGNQWDHRRSGRRGSGIGNSHIRYCDGLHTGPHAAGIWLRCRHWPLFGYFPAHKAERLDPVVALASRQMSALGQEMPFSPGPSMSALRQKRSFER